jgi:branched-chain amino acid transport system permease protein
LDPTSYTVTASVIVQIQATVGGAGSIVAGGILGATLITIMDHFLISIDPRLITLSSGVIILAVIFFLPEGVVSLPRILKRGGIRAGGWFHG